MHVTNPTFNTHKPLIQDSLKSSRGLGIERGTVPKVFLFEPFLAHAFGEVWFVLG